MLDIAKLIETYDALKAHDNAIMTKRPEKSPRAAWREQNPTPVSSSFRVIKGGKSFMARIIYDTAPWLWVYTLTSNPKVIDRIDLRADDAVAKLELYTLPAPNDMVNFEFATIRDKLGLTLTQLGSVLDLKFAANVSAYGRETNPTKIPPHIARLMRAYESGYRPADWPVA